LAELTVVPAVRSRFDATIDATRASILFTIAAVATAAAATRANRRRFRPIVHAIAAATHQHRNLLLRIAGFPDGSIIFFKK
jgi:hypothetical protein